MFDNISTVNYLFKHSIKEGYDFTEKMMKIVALACFLVASVECTARDPKLFLVSSSTSTSTLTTSSICYTSNTGKLCLLC